jgi:AcrR family transcriptional regulator
MTRRDEIVEAALVIAQRQGLAAMSMRAVAEQLGGSVMGLYRHVPTKEALLDELVGRLLAEVDLPDPGDPWPDRLRHLANQVYDLAGRYPTVVPLLITRAYVAVDAVRVVETTSGILRDAGIPADQIPRLERMLATFLLGYATSAANSAFWSDPTATAPPSAPQTRRPATAPDAAARDRWRAELERDIADLVRLIEDLARKR